MLNGYNEDMSTGYNDIPDAQKRRCMTVLELAEEMVKHQGEQKDSPAYIVLSHELHLKLAREQAKLNHRSTKLNATFTIIGAILGAGITAFFSSQAPLAVIHCQCSENRSTIVPSVSSIAGNNNPAVGIEALTAAKNKQLSGTRKPSP